MIIQKSNIFPNAFVLLSLFFLSCSTNEHVNIPSANKHAYRSFGICLVQEDTLLLSDQDIQAYKQSEHKILLNQQGMAKWNSRIRYDTNQTPPIPVLYGSLYQKDFSVKLDNDVMYEGKIWSWASSLSYNGIVILDALTACDSAHNWISIKNGYASQPSTDLRENDNIFEFFDSKGKLL